jgi:hypothetical protein
MALDVPVAFFVFNRPEKTRRVFAEIAAAQPRKLLLIADGPRNDAERSACEAAREAVKSITWPCEVLRNYSDENLGCRRRMFSGIDWVFSQCERAILLEDDCLPHPTFFRFCAELLERYHDDERVMTISGDNMQHGRRWTRSSYYFSAIPHIWGWATWRRAWKHHDAAMKDWPQYSRMDFARGLVPCEPARRFYGKMMEDTYTGKLNAWSLGWMYAAWKRRALTVLPEVNLISNIGFGADATHTRKIDQFADLPVQEMPFPLVHPARVECRIEADQSFFEMEIPELRKQRKTEIAA